MPHATNHNNDREREASPQRHQGGYFEESYLSRTGFDRLVDASYAVQSFIEDAISDYIQKDSIVIPIKALRSVEASHVTSGMWQMRTLSLHSVGEIETHSDLPDLSVVKCLTSQMKVLIRRTSGATVPISLELEVGDINFESIMLVSKLGEEGVSIMHSGATSSVGQNAVFRKYPGSREHSVGSYYYFYYRSNDPNKCAHKFSLMSRYGEMCADLYTTSGADKGADKKYGLLGVILVTEKFLELNASQYSESLEEGSISTGTESACGSEMNKYSFHCLSVCLSVRSLA